MFHVRGDARCSDIYSTVFSSSALNMYLDICCSSRELRAFENKVYGECLGVKI
jgi:hypothetical protein